MSDAVSRTSSSWGQIDQAIDELESLSTRVDGCGASPDNNDWIVECAEQLEARALIDMLIDNLGG